MTEFESQLLTELRGIRQVLEKMTGTSCVNNTPPIPTEYNCPPASPSTVYQPDNLGYVPISEQKSLKKYFFGTPDGAGFEECNNLPSIDNPRVLYVVETTDGIHGRFYPLQQGLARMRTNANSFLLPLCELSKPLEQLDDIEISPESYGTVLLKDGYWIVEEKCRI
ncbi:MAG: hypothetical protein K2N28_07365 [Muribaculaceae bacterium]|nr:hypothetical protein [Muribaculaceae bacterium]